MTQLSPLHKALAGITRATDSHFLNRLANDPDIYEKIRGFEPGRLDFSDAISDRRIFVLTGDHGAMMFHPHMPGLYECHTLVARAGRGAWTVSFVRACLHWMFTRTDAVEIMTRVPRGNLAALALVRVIDGVYEFTNRKGWVLDGDPVPAAIYSLTVQRWMKTAPGLEERGHWFHGKLEAEYKRLGRVDPNHEDDPIHDRFVGAACEMMFGGQPYKAAILYNRAAIIGGYHPLVIVGDNPITADIRDAILVMNGEDFWVAALRGPDTGA